MDNNPDGTATHLTVSLKAIPDRVLVNSAQTGKTVERLARSLEYSVKSAAGEVLVELTALEQQRDITLDDDNLHSSNRERNDVLDDLEVALFNQLVLRLQRL